MFRYKLDAYENAQFLCEGYYMKAPDLIFRAINGNPLIYFNFESNLSENNKYS